MIARGCGASGLEIRLAEAKAAVVLDGDPRLAELLDGGRRALEGPSRLVESPLGDPLLGDAQHHRGIRHPLGATAQDEEPTQDQAGAQEDQGHLPGVGKRTSGRRLERLGGGHVTGIRRWILDGGGTAIGLGGPHGRAILARPSGARWLLVEHEIPQVRDRADDDVLTHASRWVSAIFAEWLQEKVFPGQDNPRRADLIQASGLTSRRSATCGRPSGILVGPGMKASAGTGA